MAATPKPIRERIKKMGSEARKMDNREKPIKEMSKKLAVSHAKTKKAKKFAKSQY